MGDADLMAFMAEIDSIEKKNKKTKKQQQKNPIQSQNCQFLKLPHILYTERERE